MSYIHASIGGKQKGIADQVSIDPALGCENRCIGCYAFKSSQRGKNYYEKVVEKEYDNEILKKSVRKAKAQGHNVARVGKHCDPGRHLDRLNNILECCNNESFSCVVVSKSLPFVDNIASLLKERHLLHMSIGPYSDYSPSEEQRVNVANAYRQAGVKTSIRWTEDITMPMREVVRNNIDNMDYILTPMRYASGEVMSFYRAEKENFTFTGGYYRPDKIHSDWNNYLNNVCGEINGEVRCCNCLII